MDDNYKEHKGNDQESDETNLDAEDHLVVMGRGMIKYIVETKNEVADSKDGRKYNHLKIGAISHDISQFGVRNTLLFESKRFI